MHDPLAPAGPDPSHLRVALALLAADRPHEAGAVLRAASSDEVTDDPTTVPLHHWASAYSSWLLGHWDRACTEVQAGLVAADERPGCARRGASLAAVGVLVALHRDQLACAADLLGRIRQRLAVDGAGPPLWVAGAAALLLEAEGQPEAALWCLSRAWDESEQVRRLPDDRLFGPELVRLALSGENRGRAMSTAEAVERRARDSEVAAARGAALRCRGMVEDDAGLLLGAVAAFRSPLRALELAAACEETVAALAGERQTALVGPLIDLALRHYQSLGARRDIARVVGQCRVDWPEPEPALPLNSAQLPPYGLSRRELEVLGLMAAGAGTRAMAERLFVSPNTVRNHIQSILRKLDVHSRLEAVTLALRERLVPAGCHGCSPPEWCR